MLNQDHQAISYWYEWSGTTIDGEILVPTGMLRLTSNTRAKVLGEIAKFFSTLNKVITLDDVVIPYGAARHYSKANPIPVTVQIQGDTQLTIFIYDAGEAIQLIQETPRD